MESDKRLLYIISIYGNLQSKWTGLLNIFPHEPTLFYTTNDHNLVPWMNFRETYWTICIVSFFILKKKWKQNQSLP